MELVFRNIKSFKLSEQLLGNQNLLDIPVAVSIVFRINQIGIKALNHNIVTVVFQKIHQLGNVICVCVGYQPAVDNDLLPFRSSVTHKFVDPVVVVELEIMSAVHNEKAVVGTLYQKAHSAVDIGVIVLKGVENRFSVTLTARLATFGYGIFPCRHSQGCVAGRKICRYMQSVSFKKKEFVAGNFIPANDRKPVMAELIYPVFRFVDARVGIYRHLAVFTAIVYLGISVHAEIQVSVKEIHIIQRYLFWLYKRYK